MQNNNEILVQALKKPIKLNDIELVEALEPIVEDDPTYLMLKAIDEGAQATNVVLKFNRVVPSSGVAAIKILMDDGLLKHIGRARFMTTASGKAFLAQAA